MYHIRVWLKNQVLFCPFHTVLPSFFPPNALWDITHLYFFSSFSTNCRRLQLWQRDAAMSPLLPLLPPSLHSPVFDSPALFLRPRPRPRPRPRRRVRILPGGGRPRGTLRAPLPRAGQHGPRRLRRGRRARRRHVHQRIMQLSPRLCARGKKRNF